ncbi:MAG: immune inhibitor A [Anaerolineales bacterium]|nr:immune inhibitor A [Anaerolineales bacterium]
MKRSWVFPCSITILIGSVLCLMVVLGLVSISLIRIGQVEVGKGSRLAVSPVTETPTIIRSTYVPLETVNGSVVETEHLAPSDTLRELENVVLSPSDLRELAQRLEGKEDIPETVDPPVFPLGAGTQREFWATNVDTAQTFRVTTTLQKVGAHAYFWVQNEVSFSQEDLHNLIDIFDSQIYPNNRELFGSEWNPGVDGDPRLYIVYTRGLGRTLAGYYSSADQFHPLAHKYSNGHEIFFLNADNLKLGDPSTYSVMAHEFQHMIHWNLDRNEEAWVNEGFSELASFINGYPSRHEQSYAANPKIQLNDWPVSSGEISSHYGASFLFFAYFLDRFGEQAIRELAAHQSNGLAGIDAVLEERDIRDPLSVSQIQAEDVYIDWLVANILQDSTVADGRYSYSNYPNAPQISITETFDSCPTGFNTRNVHQYGFDAIQIACPGDHSLYFEGSTEVAVLPTDPYSGEYAFWSNRGDESNMTLTRAFDFRDYDGELTLSYQAWFDIEENYDYLYLVASLDGESWQILETPSGTPEDPSGNNYSWAYTGMSGTGNTPRWVHEKVDISQFAGHRVYLRFKYVTDAAVHGEGFLLDNIAISEVGYFSDFEMDDGGWAANGWVRIRNLLPQFYRLALITKGDFVSVEYVELASDNTALIPLNLDGETDETILIVTGTTRYTRQQAPYRFSVGE